MYLLKEVRSAPWLVGLLVTGQVLGIALAAWLFKRALPTRFTHYLALSGLLGVTAGGVLLLFLAPGNATALVPAAAVLLGYGAGAGVAPGLFMAGLSVPSSKLGPTFALVELLRSEAAFLLSPLLLFVAQAAVSLTTGVRLAVAVTTGLCAFGALGLLVIYLLGGARPHPPDLEGWLAGDASAYHSPPLADAVRDT